MSEENQFSDNELLAKGKSEIGMPIIRIYALSKQLNVESKEILDVVKQLGIEGKGSSLAGLTNEEVELIKNKLSDPEYIDPKYSERRQNYKEHLQRQREIHEEEERQRNQARKMKDEARQRQKESEQRERDRKRQDLLERMDITGRFRR